MDNLTPSLSDSQLKENINALQKQGLSTDKIQAYVNNYKLDSPGRYSLKGNLNSNGVDVSGHAFNPVNSGSQFVDPNASASSIQPGVNPASHIFSGTRDALGDVFVKPEQKLLATAGTRIAQAGVQTSNEFQNPGYDTAVDTGNPQRANAGGKVAPLPINAPAPVANTSNSEANINQPQNQLGVTVEPQQQGMEGAKQIGGQALTAADAIGNVALAGELLPKATPMIKSGLNTVKNTAIDLADKTVGKQAVARDLANATSKAQADALEITKPKLTPTEEATAKAQGRGTTKGKIFKTAEIKPSKVDLETANVANEAGVSKSKTFDENIQAMKDFQKSSAEKIRTGLRQADMEKPLNFTKAQFKGQLGSVMNGVERPITIVGDSAKIAAKFKTAVMKLADSVTPSREGLLDLRQGLDKLINDQLPGNIYSKDTPLGQYVKNTRRAITDFTESKIPDGKLPDGSSFKGELRKQSLLYDAIDNVSEKAPKAGEAANLPGKIAQQTKKVLKSRVGRAAEYGLGLGAGIEAAKKIAGQ